MPPQDTTRRLKRKRRSALVRFESTAGHAGRAQRRKAGQDPRAIYFFLNSASNAARPGLIFSVGGAWGPGVTMRRPVASRIVSGLNASQVLAAVLEGKRFGIG